MTGGQEQDLLELEVRELTNLLRHAASLAGLRAALAERGVMAAEAILVGLIESEDASAYGVLLLPSGGCVVFESDGNDVITRWESVKNIATLDGDFAAVAVGIAMQHSDDIS